MKVSEVSETQADNLVHMLDAYAEKGGHHLNINVFNRETLLDAQAHPEKYPQLTIRVSGYADKATGTAKRNKFLSEKRAEVVAEAIVNAGIDKDRIITEYFGDTVNPFETPEENRVAVCLVK